MIFIPLSVPSLKNSKIKTQHGIFASKTVGKYLRGLGIQSYSARRKEVIGYVNRPNRFIQCFEGWIKPSTQIVLGFHFVRGTRHSFDFNNGTQILLDLMTAHNLIEDDSMDYIVPQCIWIEGKAFSYNKENPGVYIDIIRS